MIVRSPKYLSGSRGAPCTLRIGGVCTGDTETTVPCHVHDRHSGRSQKASDLSVVDGCFACHQVFDGRTPLPNGEIMPEYERRWYGLRALQETLERRVELGLLTVAGFDPHAAPKPRRIKPRKPKSERAKVGQSRPLQSRNDLRRKPSTKGKVN